MRTAPMEDDSLTDDEIERIKRIAQNAWSRGFARARATSHLRRLDDIRNARISGFDEWWEWCERTLRRGGSR